MSRSLVIIALFSLCVSTAVAGEDLEFTPLRLSEVQGTVSFWRPGADDWGTARLNTPITADDSLYSDTASSFELQFGARAFLRAAERTTIRVVDQDDDALQLQLTSGQASLDLRELAAGQSVEIDTPNAVINVDRAGYYRLNVIGDDTQLVLRRGGNAVVTVAGGSEQPVRSDEQLAIRGNDNPDVSITQAPAPDSWDQWNFAQVSDEPSYTSSRYVPRGVYGASVLDRYGDWRSDARYGQLWYPRGVAYDWTPYSTGNWIWDRYYGWSWIDDAPWGWAPFHYGRWVHVDRYWGWAPGPIVRRPIYSPALVAFFGDVGSMRIRYGRPAVGWVPLGWGEPVCPWWGVRTRRGVPHWRGWGGPRVVNNIVVANTVVIPKSQRIRYQNARVNNGFVVVDREHFGQRRITGNRLRHAGLAHDDLRDVRGDLPVRPAHNSLAPRLSDRIARPAAAEVRKRVLARRSSRRFDRLVHADTPNRGAANALPITTPASQSGNRNRGGVFGAMREAPRLDPPVREDSRLPPVNEPGRDARGQRFDRNGDREPRRRGERPDHPPAAVLNPPPGQSQNPPGDLDRGQGVRRSGQAAASVSETHGATGATELPRRDAGPALEGGMAPVVPNTEAGNPFGNSRVDPAASNRRLPAERRLSERQQRITERAGRSDSTRFDRSRSREQRSAIREPDRRTVRLSPPRESIKVPAPAAPPAVGESSIRPAEQMPIREQPRQRIEPPVQNRFGAGHTGRNPEVHPANLNPNAARAPAVERRSGPRRPEPLPAAPQPSTRSASAPMAPVRTAPPTMERRMQRESAERSVRVSPARQQLLERLPPAAKARVERLQKRADRQR